MLYNNNNMSSSSSLSLNQRKVLLFSRITWIPLLLLWTLFCFNLGHLSGIQRTCWQQQQQEDDVPPQKEGKTLSIASITSDTTTARVLLRGDGSHDAETTGSSSSSSAAAAPTSIPDISKESIEETEEVESSQQQEIPTSNSGSILAQLPEGVSDFAAGISRIPRDEFMAAFDTGVPFKPSSPGSQEVLLFYTEESALPDNVKMHSSSKNTDTIIPLMNVTDATANCNEVHVILTQQQNQGRQQCLAIVGHHESFHIQKFLRPRQPDDSAATTTTTSSDEEPLLLLPRERGVTQDEEISIPVPTDEDRLEYWYYLEKYMSSLDDSLDKLRPIAAKAAVNNTVVVMMCNFGQSELLLNFLCSLQGRNIDTSALLIFATDRKTYDLVSAAGVNVFYDEANYGEMPEDAAEFYMDNTYTVMMLGKVFSVHMVNALGYDVLYQDVDMIWYRNPLDYFLDSARQLSESQYDVIFQEDGNNELVYAPYSANTGFYLIKNNYRTRHFLHSILMSGEWIFTSNSHQRVVTAILSEHASLFNLRIKVLSKYEGLFPGGYSYRRQKQYMLDLFAGTVHPYIFHMSWTDNKVDKLKFFQQMGEWYLDNDVCLNKTRDEILLGIVNGTQVSSMDNTQNASSSSALLSHCCILEPKVVCHYSDAPSKIPCKESPPTRKGRRSFW